MRISGKLEAMLKKPLGELLPFGEALRVVRGKRIVAVGDEVIFNFLEAGVVPFASVFDFKTRREPVRATVEKRISEVYPAPLRVEKPAGILDSDTFRAAKRLHEKGGGLLVIGEEDLFALPLALLIGRGEVVVYGQPGEGCVIVEMGSFEKGEIEKELRGMGLMLPY